MPEYEIATEKSADKMFEELKWEMIENTEDFITYAYYNGLERFFIKFDLTLRGVVAYYNSAKRYAMDLSMQELKAINKKCLELRMGRGVINNEK